MAPVTVAVKLALLPLQIETPADTEIVGGVQFILFFWANEGTIPAQKENSNKNKILFM